MSDSIDLMRVVIKSAFFCQLLDQCYIEGTKIPASNGHLLDQHKIATWVQNSLP